ncbi:AGC-kinase C-terminal domain-containing protein [Caenorhabditis elegans]|uniref:AGC-kinase C-terminal domain-containing protein n=1 Tax=Caenorhabditis elegans TaxID=6239 RepID=H1ZUV5_CAEEL|nr:AGC-kinase C-terminal domain-containing protein [Caenorhabditis elegans]CCF23366.1 AGC-kinase C-terminal domain-containing protein [Caenorhabditis elegans]|eukprot:NP_001251467.1 Uncharacterized protein CELE_C34B2.1 [Caenorhabditis elegans]
MLPKTGSFDGIPKNFRASLRKTNSEDGSDIFDYMDEGITRSILPFKFVSTKKEDTSQFASKYHHRNETRLPCVPVFYLFFLPADSISQ